MGGAAEAGGALHAAGICNRPGVADFATGGGAGAGDPLQAAGICSFPGVVGAGTGAGAVLLPLGVMLSETSMDAAFCICGGAAAGATACEASPGTEPPPLDMTALYLRATSNVGDARRGVSRPMVCWRLRW